MTNAENSPFSDHPDTTFPDVQPTNVDPFDIPQRRPDLLVSPTSEHSTSPYHAILAARAAAAEATQEAPATREPGRLRNLGRRALSSFVESSPIGAVQDLTRKTPPMIDPSRTPHAKRSAQEKLDDFTHHYDAAADRAREREAARAAADRRYSSMTSSSRTTPRDEQEKTRPTYLELQFQKIAQDMPDESRAYLDTDYVKQIDDTYNSYIHGAVAEWYQANPSFSGKEIPRDVFRDISLSNQDRAIMSFLRNYRIAPTSETIKGFANARYALYMDRKNRESNS